MFAASSDVGSECLPVQYTPSALKKRTHSPKKRNQWASGLYELNTSANKRRLKRKRESICMNGLEPLLLHRCFHWRAFMLR